MTESPYIAKSYLKVTCPFSFKFILFMTEAGLLDQVEIVPCDPNEENYEDVRTRLAELTGGKASFPTVEVESGVFMTESDELIRYFAHKNGVSAEEFPVLAYYKGGLFPRVIGLHRELRELKQKAGI